MKRKSTEYRSTPAAAIAAIALIFAMTPAPAEDLDTAAEAVALYDAGRYAEALPLLEQLAGDGASGPTLYRLFYCQRLVESPDARATMLRARTALEESYPSSNDLETPFYLSNVYRNSGRLSDAKRVAEETTAKVEAGVLTEPETGMASFQLGKLYADQDNAEAAARWYARAIEQMKTEGAAASPSLAWAARFMASEAYDDGDFERAAEYYAVASEGEPSIEDLDRWAMASSKIKDFETASKAWNLALKINPATGNRYRYAAQLALQAHQIGELPVLGPDDRPWGDLSPAELEQVMFDCATTASQILREASEIEDLQRPQRREMQDRISVQHPQFIAAALEYTLRGLPIRETAFRAGYAPMIFHASRWRIPMRRRR